MHEQHKIEKQKIKEISIKNRTCYYFVDIIILEDFDFDNILIDKKSPEFLVDLLHLVLKFR